MIPECLTETSTLIMLHPAFNQINQLISETLTLFKTSRAAHITAPKAIILPINGHPQKNHSLGNPIIDLVELFRSGHSIYVQH